MNTETPSRIAPVVISSLAADEIERKLPELGALLHACVQAGASISFVLPFTREEAEAFWRNKVLSSVRSGNSVLLVARQAEHIVGTVQLDCDTPPNQPHRAEVRKLLVHPDCRRQGIAQTLMRELETVARQRGRTLLTLDTRTGDKAEPLYMALGYQVVGIIPGYSVDPASPRLEAATVMYKLV